MGCKIMIRIIFSPMKYRDSVNKTRKEKRMAESVRKTSKTICIAFPNKEYYRNCMEDNELFRKFLNDTYEARPELFPDDFGKGFALHSFIISRKQKGFMMRRIRLKNKNKDVWQIRPSFMMPYMIAETEEVEKAIFLRRWGVPFDALAYVFGHDAMFWYNACVSLGRNSVVGTTIKASSLLPAHLLADEKHTRLNGEKIYVTTTAAKGCILGAGLAKNSGTVSLTESYRDFHKEALNLNPDYHPETVNTDGWEPTQNAWKKLFPTVAIILCFLHSFLRIRDRCGRNGSLLRSISEKVWNVYHSDTLAQFSQRVRRLREWIRTHMEEGTVRDKISELCEKASLFKIAFSYPGAYRTSNMIDRLMNYQDRILYAMQYFHGTYTSTLLYLRSMALIWNFHPYGKRTMSRSTDRGSSPFEDINGFCYHDNWLQNMLIAASMRGYRC